MCIIFSRCIQCLFLYQGATIGSVSGALMILWIIISNMSTNTKPSYQTRPFAPTSHCSNLLNSTLHADYADNMTTSIPYVTQLGYSTWYSNFCFKILNGFYNNLSLCYQRICFNEPRLLFSSFKDCLRFILIYYMYLKLSFNIPI